MKRKIVCNNFEQRPPAGMKWRRIGRPPHPDYNVRFDRGHMETGHTHCASLTEARRTAKAIVREGRAWAEVLRYAEDFNRIKSVLIASYEVEVESGSAIR